MNKLRVLIAISIIFLATAPHLHAQRHYGRFGRCYPPTYTAPPAQQHRKDSWTTTYTGEEWQTGPFAL